MYDIFFIHYSVEGHLGCFQVLALTNNDAMNIVEHMFLWYDWLSFEYIVKDGIAGTCCRLLSNFLENSLADIHGICTSMHSHQQCRNTPFIPHPLQHKLSSVFLILAILTGVWWNLRVVLSYISLVAKNVDHFLNYLLAILDPSVESSLFRFVPNFLLDYLFFW